MDIIFMSIAILGLYILVKYQDNKFSKHTRQIGSIGESIVAKRLEILGDNYIVKNNVKIGNCQIDHMVMCIDSGDIFVIETKLWGGIITGSVNDKKWMQNKNGQIRYLDNPIKQNRYHCRIVRNNYSGYKVHNVVVFVRNNNVPKSSCIINANQLVNYINKTTNQLYNRGVIEV